MKAQNIENEVAIYSVKGLKPIEVSVANDAVWLTQAQMAQLFLRDVSVISRHIKNAFNEGELDRKSNLHFLQIQTSLLHYLT